MRRSEMNRARLAAAALRLRRQLENLGDRESIGGLYLPVSGEALLEQVELLAKVTLNEEERDRALRLAGERR